MKVILTQSLPKLGKGGEIVDVSNGYARNYLLPQNLALKATTAVVKHFEERKQALARKEEKLYQDAQALAQKLADVAIVIKAKVGDEGKLYGTVTIKDISHSLEEQGFTIDRKQIDIKSPIKLMGEHLINIRLHSRVNLELKVVVEAAA